MLRFSFGRTAKVRRGGSQNPERDDEVDVELGLKLLIAHGVQQTIPVVACVVHHNVDLTEGVDRSVHQCVGRPGFREVPDEAD
nr:hypothetical protein [Mycobacterium heckeshornense]